MAETDLRCCCSGAPIYDLGESSGERGLWVALAELREEEGQGEADGGYTAPGFEEIPCVGGSGVGAWCGVLGMRVIFNGCWEEFEFGGTGRVV